MTDLPPDVPEADAIEHATEVDPGEDATPIRLDPEVPEADALEQAIEVPDDERR
jgi:hypothetical protein